MVMRMIESLNVVECTGVHHLALIVSELYILVHFRLKDIEIIIIHKSNNDNHHNDHNYVK